MEIELKEIMFGIEIVRNLFQIIENEMIMNSFLSNIEKIKVESVVPFRGGLPQLPLIVGLAGVLPDGINNLISKFVGYQNKPVKQLIGIIEEIKMEIGECREGSDISGICVTVHVRHNGFNAGKRLGFIDNCFINELKDKKITQEKIEILRLRFFRMTERHKSMITLLCNERQRNMLRI